MNPAWDFLSLVGAKFWVTLLEVSPYLLLGFFFSGLVYVLVPRVGVRKALGKPGLGSVIKAALFGVPLPLCSCSVVPTAIALRKQGASRGSTLAFLITTPETGMDSILVSAALLDRILTVFRPIAAFLTGVIAGVLEDSGKAQDAPKEEAESELCKICPSEALPSMAAGHKHSWIEKLRRALRYAFVDLFEDVVGWVFLGLLISAVLEALIPVDFFQTGLESQTLQFVLMLVIGVPLYICASASTPIAASLIHAGMSPGAALVFLLAGPATNLGSILLVWRQLGKRSTFIYLGSIVAVSVIMGLALNQLYEVLGVDPKITLGEAGEWLPEPIQWISTGLLLFFAGNCLHQKYQKKKTPPATHDSCH